MLPTSASIRCGLRNICTTPNPADSSPAAAWARWASATARPSARKWPWAAMPVWSCSPATAPSTLNLNEGCTAVSYDLPIITVIFNNQVLGMVRQWQTTFYEKRYSDTDPHRKTDFVKLAEAFGAKGYRATTPAEFKVAFTDAMKQQGPSWIDCRIGKDEKVLPMIPGGGTIEDIIME